MIEESQALPIKIVKILQTNYGLKVSFNESISKYFNEFTGVYSNRVLTKTKDVAFLGCYDHEQAVEEIKQWSRSKENECYDLSSAYILTTSYYIIQKRRVLSTIAKHSFCYPTKDLKEIKYSVSIKALG